MKRISRPTTGLHPVGSCGGALRATTGCHCLAAGIAGSENDMALGEFDYACPPGYDPEWFDRLQPHQRRDLVEDGTLTVRDAGDDPVELRPGVIDDNADWAYKNGQCLALAVALAEQNGWKVVCTRVDQSDADPDGNPFLNLKHAYAERRDGMLVDINGEQGTLADVMSAYYSDEGFDNPEWRFGDVDDFNFGGNPPVPDPERFESPRDALAHFDGFIVDQDLTVAEPFARVVRANTRLDADRFFTGRPNYRALAAEDARALLDVHLQRRYTAGDCGILAHHLAEQNGWGVCVVGSFEEEDYGDGHVYYGVEQLAHAYAIRPDGNLVDVTGVHEPAHAAELADRWGQWGVGIHTYPDAKSADRVWNHEQWYGGDRWGDSYDEEDEKALADHVARLVTIAYEDSDAR